MQTHPQGTIFLISSTHLGKTPKTRGLQHTKNTAHYNTSSHQSSKHATSFHLQTPITPDFTFNTSPPQSHLRSAPSRSRLSYRINQRASPNLQKARAQPTQSTPTTTSTITRNHHKPSIDPCPSSTPAGPRATAPPTTPTTNMAPTTATAATINHPDTPTHAPTASPHQMPPHHDQDQHTHNRNYNPTTTTTASSPQPKNSPAS
jgi:hypothetical protein